MAVVRLLRKLVRDRAHLEYFKMRPPVPMPPYGTYLLAWVQSKLGEREMASKSTAGVGFKSQT